MTDPWTLRELAVLEARLIVTVLLLVLVFGGWRIW